MEYGIAVCTSITTAQRVKRLAVKEQIKGVSLMQLPASLAVKGCNYSIRSQYCDFQKLCKLCGKHSLTIKATYLETLEQGKKVYHRL